jgi:hypothetical protein
VLLFDVAAEKKDPQRRMACGRSAVSDGSLVQVYIIPLPALSVSLVRRIRGSAAVLQDY